MFSVHPIAAFQRRRTRRLRGREGERRVAEALDAYASAAGVKVRHGLPLRTRDGRRGDLDHTVALGRRPRWFVAIETKAEQPRREHLDQVETNAARVSRRHFRGAPQYRIVVHPNSAEPITYDVRTQAARMGLPHLTRYLDALLAGAHGDRLAR